MKYHIIYNPTAKSGKSKAAFDRVIARLQEAEKEFEVHETLFKGHAEVLASELGVGEKEIIVIGGDGTVHEVLNGIVSPESARLAIIPAGTGNDFCVAAGIPEDTDLIMDKVLKGETKGTDYIDFAGRRCMNVGGLGMDVDVLERVMRGRTHGKLKYLRSLLVSIFAFKGYEVKISVNGEVHTEKALFAAVCNGSQIGGGIKICPGAKIDDGKLEVVLVKRLGFFGIIKTFIALMQGKILTCPVTKHFYCEAAEILPDAARTIQLDGELYHDYRVLDAKIQRGLKIYR